MDTSLTKLDESIYQYRYLIRLNTSLDTDAERANVYGTYITENKNVDNDSHNRLNTVMLTIYEMAVKHGNGVPIFVVAPGNKELIYKALDAYISYWTNKLSSQSKLNTTNHPQDQLLLLDRLATDVFSYNQNLMRKIAQDNDNIFSDNPNMTTMDNLFKKPEVVQNARQEITRDDTFLSFLNNNLKHLKRD